MQSETGFFYLNLANEWAKFDLLDPNITTDSNGAMMLARPTGDAFASRGLFQGGPFTALDGPTPWYRLQAYAEPLHDGTHVQLFTLTTDENSIGPFDAGADEPFPQAAGWQAAPPDVLDMVIPHPPAHFLWIGGVLRSDGQALARYPADTRRLRPRYLPVLSPGHLRQAWITARVSGTFPVAARECVRRFRGCHCRFAPAVRSLRCPQW